jgi:hypothetical protein
MSDSGVDPVSILTHIETNRKEVAFFRVMMSQKNPSPRRLGEKYLASSVPQGTR